MNVSTIPRGLPQMTDPRHLYLDLMKKCLTFSLWGESVQPADLQEAFRSVPAVVVKTVQSFLASRDLQVMKTFHYDPARRQLGQDWPPQADTMIGTVRLDNLQSCVEEVIAQNVPGDVIETGCWRGGASIFMRAVLNAYGVADRTVWVADSFEGLPPPDEARYPQDAGDHHHTIRFLAVSLEEVQRNFQKYGLLDNQVKFLKGWFKDTLPTAPIKQLAVIRLDGDMYESTMDGLNNLYPKLSPGGFVIVDDYVLKNCKAAVHDFREKHAIRDEIVDIDGTGAYWKKSA
jgi:hypothetical protein